MIPAELDELATSIAAGYGRSILDDRVGIAEILGSYDFMTTDEALDQFENLIRLKLDLPTYDV